MVVNHRYHFYHFVNFTNYVIRRDPSKSDYGDTAHYTAKGGYWYKSYKGNEPNTLSYNAYGLMLSTSVVKMLNYTGLQRGNDSVLPSTVNQRKLRFSVTWDTTWQRYGGTFTADSAYKQIILGNFWHLNEITFSRPFDKESELPGIFFIDSVNLWDVTFSISANRKVVCKNDTIGLSQTSYSTGYTEWYGSRGNYLGTGDSLTILADTTGFIRAKRIFPEIDVQETDSVFIEVNSPKGKYTIQRLDTCKRPTTFAAAPKIFTYTWDNMLTAVTFKTNNTGILKLVVEDAYNCKDSATFMIEPLPKVYVSQLGDSCTLPAQFVAMPNYLDYLWNEKADSNVFKTSESGNLVIQGINKEGCKDTVEKMVYATPNFKLDLLSDSCANPLEIAFTNSSLTYWLSSQSISNPAIISSKDKVIFTGKDSRNCALDITLDLSTCFSDIWFVPNAFSPNSGEGNNRFAPIAQGNNQFKVTIYNRWGQKIFESKNDHYSWDGTYLDKDVPQGVYFYSITKLSNNKTRAGIVHVLR